MGLLVKLVIFCLFIIKIVVDVCMLEVGDIEIWGFRSRELRGVNVCESLLFIYFLSYWSDKSLLVCLGV